MPDEMNDRTRISEAIAATRGKSEAEVQRAIFEAMRVGANRWAAFTDDELEDVEHALSHDLDPINRNRSHVVWREVVAEQRRREAAS